MEVRELPVPDLERNSGILHVELSEVCGTDVYLQQGRLEGVPYPIIPGHVSVGIIEKIRGELRDVEGRLIREGDRVTFLDVHATCNACWHCLVAKSSTRCPKRKVYGITYGIEDGLCGGWAQSVYLKPGTRCIPLGTADSESFMFGGCSLPTALHAVERAGDLAGATVLVLGSGPVGLSCVILSRQKGASQVLCIGGPANRLEVAEAVGADGVIGFEGMTEEERRDWVFERTSGRGGDVTIEATGSPQAVVQAMRWTRDAGRVVVVGQYTDHGEVLFNPHKDLNRKHLDLLGCWGSDFSHFYKGVQIFQNPVLSSPWKQVRSDRYGLSQTQQALDAVASGKAVKALIDPAI
jgi:L-iditol 2-dehydrogenase